MATYTVTTTNWNSAAFWSGISESAGGHILDFSGLPATYTVDLNEVTGTITINDGTTVYTIGDTGSASVVDVTMGGTTLIEYFDNLTFGAGNDEVEGNDGNETINMGDGTNRYYDFGGADTVTGGANSDYFYVGNGDGANNAFDGGAGTDFLYLQGTSGTAINAVLTANGTGSFTFSDGTSGTFTNVERVYGGSGDDTIDASVTTVGSVYFGNAGSDSITGGSGNDSFYDGSGDDTMRGGAGDDFFVAEAGNDLLDGGAGSDRFVVQNTDGADTIIGGESAVDADRLELSGTAATVTLTGAESGTVQFSGSADTVTFSQIEEITGTVNNDVMDASVTTTGFGLSAGAGADTVIGGSGADTLGGGDGADSVTGNDGGDFLTGGAGIDTLDGGAGDDVILGGSEGDLISSGTGADQVSGGSGGDTITNISGADTIDGGTGADSIVGSADAESIVGGSGVDTIFGGGGDDTITGDGTDLGIYAGTLSSYNFNSADMTTGDTGNGTIGSWAYYNNIGTSSDGTQIAARLTIVDADNPNIQVDFNNNSVFLNGDGAAAAGTGVQLQFEFFDAVTGEPVQIDSNFTFQDVDTTSESVTANSADVTSFSTSADPVTNLTVINDGEIIGGQSDNTSSSNVDENHWAQFAVDSQQTILFTVTSRGGGTNYGFSSTDFTNPPVTVVSNPELANDYIDAGDGNDLVAGGEGADTILGGSGSDTISGDAGADSLDGGTGDDDLILGTGDTAIGGGGDDEFIIDSTNTDGPGTITIDGGSDATSGAPDGVQNGDAGDTLDTRSLTNVTWLSGPTDDGTGSYSGSFTYENDAGDTITVNFSEIENVLFTDNIVQGTAGDDIIIAGYVDADGTAIDGTDAQGTHGEVVGSDSDSIQAGDGNDSVDAGAGIDTVDGGAGNDTINLGDGADTVLDSAGDDLVTGGEGKDRFDYTTITGNDTVIGGELNDTTPTDSGDKLDAHWNTDNLTVVFTGDEAGTMTDGTDTVTFSEIEHIMGGQGSDFIDASASTVGQILDGGENSDTIQGGSGDDIIAMGLTQDFSATDGNNDLLILADGFGNDSIEGFETPTDLGGGTYSGNDLLDVSGLHDANGSPVNVDDVTVTDTNGDGTGDAVLTFPNGESITLWGVSVTDVSSDAQLVAMGIPAPDYVVEGTAGNDTIDATYVGDPEGDMIDANDHSDGSNNDSVLAGAGNDSILSGAGDDTVFGQDGADTIFGGAGNDTLDGDDVFATGGADLIYGEDGNDQIIGDVGNDTLDGGAGNDTIFAGDDSDLIVGGTGADQMYGESGDDFFQIADTFGNDTIVGGETGEVFGDTLDLAAVTTGVTVDLSGVNPEAGTFSDGTSTATFSEIENIVLSGGRDTIVLADGSGADTVQAFDMTDSGDGTTNDQLDVSGLTSDGGTTPVNTGDVVVTDDGTGNAVLTFPGGESITLVGVAPAQVDTPAELEAIGIPADSNDNIVQGTSAGDLIGAGYVDADGTAVDGNDALGTHGEVIGSNADSIQAGDGADTVFAGADNDTVDGGAGFDEIYGEGGDDSLLGGAGVDSIYGGDGADTIDGGLDADSIEGGAGNDSIVGGDGWDNLFGDAGDDTLLGGADSDVIWGGDGADLMDGGTGDDTLVGGAGALDGNDTALGGDGNDRIDAGTGDDLMDGGADADRFTYGTNYGSDTIIGGEAVTTGLDEDTINSSFQANNVNITYTGAEAGTIVAGADTITFSEIENQVLTSGADTVDGSLDTAGLDIQAGDGADQLTGGSGADSLLAEGGDDTISLLNGFGNDTIVGGETGETNGDTLDLTGVTNNTTVDLTSADPEAGTVTDGTSTATFSEIENIELGAGRDTIVLADGSGSDTVQAFDMTDSGDGTTNDQLDVSGLTSDGGTTPVTTADVVVTDDGSGNAVLTFPGGESITLIGVAPAQVDEPAELASIGIPDGRNYIVEGTAGADNINAGYVGDPQGDLIDANDHIDGSNNDSVRAGDGNDTVISGLGDDTVDAGTGDDSVRAGDGNDSILGGAGADSLYGEAGADTILGGDGADFIDGGAGLDSLVGGAGNDTINGGTESDTIWGGADNDSLVGGGGDDYLNGEDGNDELIGDAGNDLLDAGAGDDLVFGGVGNDSMFGGTGADSISGDDGDDVVFIEDNFGNDTILGGETGETIGDTLDLSGNTTGVTVDLSSANPEAGTISDGTSTATFAEIENIVLGSGRDTIVLADGSGADAVFGFDMTDSGDGTTNDQLDVSGMTDANGAQVNTGDVVVTDDGSGNSVLTFPGGESITLMGVAPAQLSTQAQLASIGIPAPDYIVEGTVGDDLIDGSYVGDPEGDVVDGGDGNPSASDPNVDVIEAGAGNDTVFAGDANDTVMGEGGNDSIFGEAGNDTLYGNAGDDTIQGGIGNDFIQGGTGADSLYGQDGADRINDGAGNDYVEGGADADIFYTQDGWGVDTIVGGETGTDFDTLQSYKTGDVTLDLTAGVATDPESGTLVSGADTVIFSEIEAVNLGAGNDTVIGSSGNDSVDAGAGADVINGGAGDDTFNLGTGDTDRDTLILTDGFGNDTIQSFDLTDSGDGTAIDQVDVSTLTADDGSLVNVWDVVVTDTNGDGTGDAILTFPNGESITLVGITPDQVDTTAELNSIGIPCFTPGTEITTEHGKQAVETLKPGDRVLTADNGIQEVKWVGKRTLSRAELDANPEMCPVLIRKGAFGNTRKLLVSPQHGLIQNVEGQERLIRAKHAAELYGGQVARVVKDCEEVTYIHVMFEQHELIYSEDMVSESFFPGFVALRGLESGAAQELLQLFPELTKVAMGLEDAHMIYGSPARAYLRRKEFSRAA